MQIIFENSAIYIKLDRYSQPLFIREYTLSLSSRTIITGLQNFRCLVLKYLWRYIYSFTLSNVFVARTTWSLYRTFSCSFSNSVSVFHLAHSQPYYSCKKAAGVNSKSFYAGRVQKPSEAPLSFRLLFSSSFHAQVTSTLHLIFIRYLGP